MEFSRRSILAGGSAAGVAGFAGKASADWPLSGRYPDPSIRILDPSFARYRVGNN